MTKKIKLDIFSTYVCVCVKILIAHRTTKKTIYRQACIIIQRKCILSACNEINFSLSKISKLDSEENNKKKLSNVLFLIFFQTINYDDIIIIIE
jgi:hypothetical protein